MSDYLDNDAQINAFLEAMIAGPTISSSRHPAAVTNMPETAFDPNESAESSRDGGLVLTGDAETQWNEGTANISTAVDTENEREMALDQVRSSINEAHLTGEASPTAITQEVETPYHTNHPSPSRQSTHHGQSGAASPIVTGIRPPPSTPQTVPDIGDVVQDILGEFAASSPFTLADSIHAPRHTGGNSVNRNLNYSNARSTTKQTGPLATLYEAESVDTSRIEDTAAFEAAINAQIQQTQTKSIAGSVKTIESDTTVARASSTTAKKENRPLQAKSTSGFSEDEARNLLVSPTKMNVESGTSQQRGSTSGRPTSPPGYTVFVSKKESVVPLTKMVQPDVSPKQARGIATEKSLAETFKALEEEKFRIQKREELLKAMEAHIKQREQEISARESRILEKERSQDEEHKEVKGWVHEELKDAQLKKADVEGANKTLLKEQDKLVERVKAQVSSGSPVKRPSGASLLFTPKTEGAITKPAYTNGADSTQERSEDQENREHLTHFQSWGTAAKGDRPDRPAAQFRKVIISNLPASIAPRQLTAFVFKGAIDSFNLTPATSNTARAEVTFTNGDACKKYLDSTPNGLRAKMGGVEVTVMVDLYNEKVPVSSQLAEWLEKGYTRCVRAVGLDRSWSIQALWRVAEGTKRVMRKVENVTDTINQAGNRTVTFRFMNIADAVQFKGVLARDEDWEHVNVTYAPDPCEKAESFHVD